MVVQINGPLSSVSCFLKVVSSRCLEMCRGWASFKLILSLSLVDLSSVDFLSLMCFSLTTLSGSLPQVLELANLLHQQHPLTRVLQV